MEQRIEREESAVSLITTVLNEAQSIGALLDSLLQQTRLPNEVLIVDGGSQDGTLELLHEFSERAPFPVVALYRPGCNISEGWNVAIAAARAPLIAVTDAGVRLEQVWLEELVAPLQEGRADVTSGAFRADPQSLFELALGAVTLPLPEEVRPESFQPSSRSVAFRREAWQAVGGYPEWLDYCEDLLFDFSLRDEGYRFAFASRALVHFRPRANLRAFCRQYYRYSRGDGKADFWRYRHLIRYTSYLVLMPLVVALALLVHPLWWLSLLAGLGAMLRKPLGRLRSTRWLSDASRGDGLKVLAWLPVIRVVGDVSKMLGYPVGLWWRWRRLGPRPATWAKRQF